MNEEERRRCCLLGGCGCGPGGGAQLQAMAEELAIAMGWKPEERHRTLKAATAMLEIFGTGPHVDRLRALGLDKNDRPAESGNL